MKPFLLILCFCEFIFLPAQTTFTRKDSIPVFANSVQMENPWTGGINSAQFSEIDLNQDGTMDLFIFDRSGNKITTYLNGGTANQVDYKFVSNYITDFPKLQFWVLLRDYNCDGKMDIFTCYNGSTQGISIWKNISSVSTGLQFQLVVDPLLSNYTPNSTNSIQTLYASSIDIPAIRDVDFDGDLDVLTFDPSGIHVEFHRNMSMENYGVCDSLVYRLESNCWGEFTENFSGSSVTLFTTCPPVPIYENRDDITHSPYSLHTGSCLECIQVGNDHDQDLLLGDLNTIHMKYLQNGGSNLYAQMNFVDDTFPIYDTHLSLNFFPCPFHIDVNNDGKKDVLFSPNSGYNSENFHSCYLYQNIISDTDVTVNYVENNFIQNSTIDVGESAFPTFFDYDYDGDKDLFIGNYGYYPVSGFYISEISLYKNIGSATVPQFTLMTTDFANVHVALPSMVGMSPTFGDLDGDGDFDMLIGDSFGRLTYMKKQAGPADNFSVSQTFYQSIDVGSYATPQLIDVDRDGKIDLLIGELDGNVNYYRNTGTLTAPVFTLVTTTFGNVHVNEPSYITGLSSPCMYDSSGTYVLLVGSERGWLNRYDSIDGNLSGTFIRTDSMYVSTYEGARLNPGVTDLNGDGLKDIAIGNLSGGVSIFYGNGSITTGQLVNSTISSFEIFPNPANEYLTIATSERSEQGFHFFIYDLTGKTVQSQLLYSQRTTVDISQLAQGIYICAIVDDNGFAVNHKFVISR